MSLEQVTFEDIDGNLAEIAVQLHAVGDELHEIAATLEQVRQLLEVLTSGVRRTVLGG